jgi:hypothetical protein
MGSQTLSENKTRIVVHHCPSEGTVESTYSKDGQDGDYSKVEQFTVVAITCFGWGIGHTVEEARASVMSRGPRLKRTDPPVGITYWFVECAMEDIHWGDTQVGRRKDDARLFHIKEDGCCSDGNRAVGTWA